MVWHSSMEWKSPRNRIYKNLLSENGSASKPVEKGSIIPSTTQRQLVTWLKIRLDLFPSHYLPKLIPDELKS